MKINPDTMIDRVMEFYLGDWKIGERDFGPLFIRKQWINDDVKFKWIVILDFTYHSHGITTTYLMDKDLCFRYKNGGYWDTWQEALEAFNKTVKEDE